MYNVISSANKVESKSVMFPIDFSDIPATTAKDWQGAVRGQFYKPIKQQLTVRVDADVVEWLKGQGRGYQSRLNQILRAAMLKNIQHR